MKNYNKFLSTSTLLILASLACSFPGFQLLPSEDEINSALTETAITQSEQGSTPTGEFTTTPTGTIQPTATETSTSTSTSTFTFTPIPPSATNTPTNTPVLVFPIPVLPKGSINGLIFFDINLNGLYNPETGDTPAQGGASILEGPCPGGEKLYQAFGGANGAFLISDIPIGTYCVKAAPQGIKTYTPTIPSPAQRTVNVLENQTVSAGAFGYLP